MRATRARRRPVWCGPSADGRPGCAAFRVGSGAISSSPSGGTAGEGTPTTMDPAAEGTTYPAVPFVVDPSRVAAFRALFGIGEGSADLRDRGGVRRVPADRRRPAPRSRLLRVVHGSQTTRSGARSTRARSSPSRAHRVDPDQRRERVRDDRDGSRGRRWRRRLHGAFADGRAGGRGVRAERRSRSGRSFPSSPASSRARTSRRTPTSAATRTRSIRTTRSPARPGSRGHRPRDVHDGPHGCGDRGMGG